MPLAEIKKASHSRLLNNFFPAHLFIRAVFSVSTEHKTLLNATLSRRMQASLALCWWPEIHSTTLFTMLCDNNTYSCRQNTYLPHSPLFLQLFG